MPPQDTMEKLLEFVGKTTAQIEYLTKSVDKLNEKMDILKEDVATLKTKASIYGGIAGLGGSILLLILKTFIK